MDDTRSYTQLFQPSPYLKATTAGQVTYPSMRHDTLAARALTSPGRDARRARPAIVRHGIIDLAPRS